MASPFVIGIQSKVQTNQFLTVILQNFCTLGIRYPAKQSQDKRRPHDGLLITILYLELQLSWQMACLTSKSSLRSKNKRRSYDALLIITLYLELQLYRQMACLTSKSCLRSKNKRRSYDALLIIISYLELQLNRQMACRFAIRRG